MTAPSLDAVLAEGVRRALITADQAAALAGIARESVAPETSAPEIPSDDERVRLVTGFADIFVTLGIGLFLGAAGWLGSRALPPWAASALIAVLAWGLAEFFTRLRRMALPSIVLLAVFAYASFAAAAALVGNRAGLGAFALFDGWGRSAEAAGRVALAAVATAALVGAHYRRFRVPITVAACLAALLAACLALLAALAPDFVHGHHNALFVAAGLIAFAAAMRFDLADPARTTRTADIAFWLHLLAAPLIVHPLMGRLSGPDPDAGSAAAILAVFAGLAVAALIVDRRAMLVSGLVYAGLAFGSLVQRAGVADLTVPLTVLMLGAFVILISAGWRPLRGGLLRLLPPGAAARLPHPQAIA